MSNLYVYEPGWTKERCDAAIAYQVEELTELMVEIADKIENDVPDFELKDALNSICDKYELIELLREKKQTK